MKSEVKKRLSKEFLNAEKAEDAEVFLERLLGALCALCGESYSTGRKAAKCREADETRKRRLRRGVSTASLITVLNGFKQIRWRLCVIVGREAESRGVRRLRVRGGELECGREGQRVTNVWNVHGAQGVVVVR
jgi:hypothetical protein